MTFITAPTPAWAQDNAAQTQTDPIAQRLFPPDLVIGHADDIALTVEQRHRVIAEVARLQADLSGIAPRGEAARAQMAAALGADQVNEAQVLQGLDGVLGVERDIKRLHIGALVRIRNILSATQRTRLNALR
jgi:hypothetical protein